MNGEKAYEGIFVGGSGAGRWMKATTDRIQIAKPDWPAGGVELITQPQACDVEDYMFWPIRGNKGIWYLSGMRYEDIIAELVQHYRPNLFG